MKHFLLLAFLLIQQTICGVDNLHKYTLNNGIDVVLYRDTSTPAVSVHLVFDFGSIDEPINMVGIGTLIMHSLLSKPAYLQLNNLGITCSLITEHEYSAISASMHPKDLKQFLHIICSEISSLHTVNLDNIKQRLVTLSKLQHYSHDLDRRIALYANIEIANKNTRHMFAPETFKNISIKDLQCFFDDIVSKCHLTLIVCGSIEEKQLKQALAVSLETASPRQHKHVKNKCTNSILKKIRIENKYASNAIFYVYRIPLSANRFVRELALRILALEREQYLSSFQELTLNMQQTSLLTKGDYIVLSRFSPKRDVAISDIEKYNDLFDKTIFTRPGYDKNLAVLSMQQDLAFIQHNLPYMSGYLIRKTVANEDIYDIFNIEQNYENIDIHQIQKFLQEDIMSNLILKLRTQFGENS